jgi:hypothetical protein
MLFAKPDTGPHFQTKAPAGCQKYLVETVDRRRAIIECNCQVERIPGAQPGLVTTKVFHCEIKIACGRRQHASAAMAAFRLSDPIRTSRASAEENSTRVQWLIANGALPLRPRNRSILSLVASGRKSGTTKLVSR